VTREEIRSEVMQSLLGVAPEARPESLKPDQELREQLEIDSYDFLNFIIALDKRLKVSIPESDYQHLATLDSCVEYLARRMEKV